MTNRVPSIFISFYFPEQQIAVNSFFFLIAAVNLFSVWMYAIKNKIENKYRHASKVDINILLPIKCIRWSMKSVNGP